MKENSEQANNLEKGNENINNFEFSESEKNEDLENINEASSTSIDKELQKIKKLVIVVMGLFVIITIIIFLWNIFYALWNAIKSDEFEYIRSEENYKITEIFEQDKD